MLAIVFALAGCAVPSLLGAGPTATPTVGVPSDVPLPQGSRFATTGHPAQTGARVWIYTVASSDAQHVEAYYRTALPQQGWTNYQADFATTNGGQSVSITAQKFDIGQRLTITAGPGPVGSLTITTGGVILQLTLSPTGV